MSTPEHYTAPKSRINPFDKALIIGGTGLTAIGAIAEQVFGAFENGLNPLTAIGGGALMAAGYRLVTGSNREVNRS